MDNLYYYIYDAETKTIKPKYLESGANAKGYPSDIILGLEFYAPEKAYAEQCAKEYNKRVVTNIADLETAADDALYIELCKDCKRAFAINKEEFMWYKTRDLIPPKRCKACREKRKRENSKENK